MPTARGEDRGAPDMIAGERRGTIGRKLALQLVLWPLLLLGLELGTRLWLASSGQGFDSETARAEFLALGDWMVSRNDTGEESNGTGTTFVHPFMGWFDDLDGDDFHRTQRYFQDQEEGEFDVMIVGGSVAGQVADFGQGVIIDPLNADPRLVGRKIRVHKYARGGYKQP